MLVGLDMCQIYTGTRKHRTVPGSARQYQSILGSTIKHCVVTGITYVSLLYQTFSKREDRTELQQSIKYNHRFDTPMIISIINQLLSAFYSPHETAKVPPWPWPAQRQLPAQHQISSTLHFDT
jgi:hypothetical protein